MLVVLPGKYHDFQYLRQPNNRPRHISMYLPEEKRVSDSNKEQLSSRTSRMVFKGLIEIPDLTIQDTQFDPNYMTSFIPFFRMNLLQTESVLRKFDNEI